MVFEQFIRYPRSFGAGCGETSFPHTPARGRVWEGAALPRRNFMFIPSECGAAPWTALARAAGLRIHEPAA
jgi:hypothetical protein